VSIHRASIVLEVSFHSSPFSGTFKKVNTSVRRITPTFPMAILCTARFDVKKSTMSPKCAFE